MSPTIHKQGPYRFFFNSREETRMHIHVMTPDGTAKFWLEPLIALSSTFNSQGQANCTGPTLTSTSRRPH